MKRFFDENSILSSKTAKELADFYHYHLTQEIIPEWKDRSLDQIYGGYETNFNESWQIVGNTKNLWAQARNLIMFTLMYQHIDHSDHWRQLIDSGHKFLIEHFYNENGVWNYRTSNDGQSILEGPISLLGDMFAMGALSRYVIVTGNNSDLPLITETFYSVKKHLKDPNYKNIMPHVWCPDLERHSHYMLMVNVLESVEEVLGKEIVHPLLMECIDKILYFFARQERDYHLFEYRSLNGTPLNTDAGHLINPGHIFESMWFCLRICLKTQDAKRIKRILEITDRTFDISIDRKYGGIFHLLDSTGKTAYVEADLRNRQLNWDDKVDWVNAEALYLFALIAVTTKDPKDFLRFLRQHNYCQEHFFDPEHGDWITTLTADGIKTANNKGTKHRCAFHVPRAILDTYLIFNDLAKKSEDFL